MKKTLFSLSLIAFASVLMVSCKKDRVCECTDTDGTVYKTTLLDAGKQQAKDYCTSQTIEFSGQVINKVTCEVK